MDGKVHLRCPFGSLLWIEKVTLDGVEYPLNGHEVVADTTTEPFKIEIPDLESLGGPATFLHVVDKETHAELEHVSIAPYDLGRPRELRFSDHPGAVPNERLVIADGVSPVRLRDPTGRNGQSVLCVRAAGYAWTKYQHDWSKPAERTIELERACDLSITLEPSIDASGMVIAVSRLKEREAVIEQYLGFLARFLDEKGSAVPGNERSVSSLRSDIAELESSEFAPALIRASGLPCAREAPARSGATRIEVEFRHGGRSLMCVEDNGHGMSRDDAFACTRAADSGVDPHSSERDARRRSACRTGRPFPANGERRGGIKSSP